MQQFNNPGSLIAKNYHNNLHDLRLGNHYPQQESQKIHFSPVNFYDSETRFNSQNYFSQAEISNGSGSKGTLFDHMKVSEKGTEPKTTEMRQFPQSIRNLVSSI